MPIYEYLCQVCGHALEVMQKINAPLLIACPACAKPALKKQVSAAGFQLKGSGWYATDFKNKGKKDSKDSNDGKDSNEGSNKDKQKEPAATEAKSESAPASASPGASTSGTAGHGGGTCGCH